MRCGTGTPRDGYPGVGERRIAEDSLNRMLEVVRAARRGEVHGARARDAEPRMAETRVVCVPHAIMRSVHPGMWAVDAAMVATVR